MSTKMSTAIVAILPLLMMGGSEGAIASDLNDPMIEDRIAKEKNVWTGIYATVFGGYGWADYDHRGDFFGGDYSLTLEDSNWFVGAGLGGDHQVDRVVFGVVVDAAYSELGDSKNIFSGLGRVNTDIEYFGTARGRLGYLLKDNLLAYATGGLAWAKIETSVKQSGFEWVSTDDSHLGWTVGGGLEWALNEHVSITGEYLYLNFEEEEISVFDGAATYEPELDMHTVKGGINYKF